MRIRRGIDVADVLVSVELLSRRNEKYSPHETFSHGTMIAPCSFNKVLPSRQTLRRHCYVRSGSDVSDCCADCCALNFGGIADFAVDIAKIAFFVAIALFVTSMLVSLMHGRLPTEPYRRRRS
jgi:uncharacterized membrane protein YtjA (UPF0391 family)